MEEQDSLLSLPIFAHGIFNENKYTCSLINAGEKLNRFHFRGTALGGWLVLEPWITPSMFYQFLGASER
jgi:glucan 1,3-beta-glucosidase